jgi:uncharacterized protein YgfB (UPF0149 family)
MFVNNVRNFVTLLSASNNFYYKKQFLVGLGFQQNILDRIVTDHSQNLDDITSFIKLAKT